MILNQLCISHIFLAAAYCGCIFLVLVHCQMEMEDNDSNAEAKLPEKREPESEEHTFVALIDIVFTDGSKKSCTGSIIHDNVVITAAHCFVRGDHQGHSHHSASTSHKKRKMPTAVPELTTSFVVIGTRKMFQSGYEQYLPIERIATHPNFRGWTADLTLVFTFAVMTADKPGTIIPLANSNYFAPVDSNLTVFSWGHPAKEAMYTTATVPAYSDKGCSESKEVPDSIPNEKDQIKDDGTLNIYQAKKIKKNEERIQRAADRENINQKHQNQMLRKRFRKQLQTNKQSNAKEYIKKAFSTTAKVRSRYLFERDKIEEKKDENRHKRYLDSEDYTTQKTIHDNITTEQDLFKRVSVDQHTTQSKTYAKRTTESKRPHTQQTGFQPYKLNYKSWRRQMGSQQNILTADLFTFTKVKSCKKIVEKSMPPLYQIKDSNEIVCYSNERRVITIDDSGAPVVQQGHLVAVTVGGVTDDDEHVAVGMKMSYFCSWIAYNLPDGGKHLQC